MTVSIAGRPSSRLRTAPVRGALLGAVLWPLAFLPVGSANAGNIDLLLTDWDPAMYETPDGKEECPDGMQFSNGEQWQAQFPTQAERDEFTRRYIHLGPTTPGGSVPEIFTQNRGPNGANIVYSPEMVVDPLPLREVQGDVALGMNLDGEEEGAATPKTCAHRNFTSPDGERGIDNQLYRLYGCAKGWREGGINRSYNRFQIVERHANRLLIRISQVDDERNDDHVMVTTYKGLDRIGADASGRALRGLTYRADTRLARYVSRTVGRIVDGVLTTEPVNWRSALHLMNADAERLLLDARMRLKLTDQGASGMVGGYEDLRLWWNTYSKAYSALTDSISFWSPPAMYAGALRHADGSPDPVTGQCTAISAAYKIEAVRVHIVAPPDTDPLIVEAREAGVEIVNVE